MSASGAPRSCSRCGSAVSPGDAFCGECGHDQRVAAAADSGRAEEGPKRDFYEVLGVDRAATPDQLRAAYQREAAKHSPDRNPGDPRAEAELQAVHEAYQVLSNDEQRRRYDQFGHAGLTPGFAQAPLSAAASAELAALFSSMFSGAPGTSPPTSPPKRE